MPERPARSPAQAPTEERALSVTTEDGVTLAGEQSGAGAPGTAIVLLHGLTATRRYVVMGSRQLERSGHRVLAYDARGHGHSTPAPDPAGYGYQRLAGDLRAVLDACGIERALLAGVSMGAHTALRFALEQPQRVAALAIITPAFDPHSARGEQQLARWDALARGLRAGGVDGFLAAYDLEPVARSLRATIELGLRQRLAAHEHPDAVADALEAVPRSRPFEDFAQLADIGAPSVVVASHDEADPDHPLALGERYAQALPDATLVVEQGGSPIAWQGGQLSRVLAELAARARGEGTHSGT